MGQFFKMMFASMLGILVLIVLFIFLIGGLISASMQKEVVEVKNNSVLHLKLSQGIEDRVQNDPFSNFDFKGITKEQPGLYEIIQLLHKAETDTKITGVFIDMSSVSSGFANIQELRNAIVDFKKSKKFVIAYAESFTTGAYYLASAADKIYLNPMGEVDFKGLHTELMFFKGTLEKLEIEPEIIRHGKFKSAVEPYILDRMSDENRAQLASLIDDLWENVLDNISRSRKISFENLQGIADSLSAQTAQQAKDLRLVDQVAYYDEVENDLKKKSGIADKDKINFVSVNDYYNSITKETAFGKDKVAVIYASGAIVSGKGQNDEIGSATLCEQIRKARRDDNIKAIVLRINSPGGDALASEVIWRETMLAKKEKPFIVSMGNYAASGGYYIACAADTIVAQRGTITGSIGVFGLLFNAKNLLNNKLGVTTDTYKTATYADLGTISRPLTAAERNIMQNSVERVYGTFTQRVSDGRHMAVADVDSIGQGRVWSSEDAKEIGLVDVLGGLEDAIAIAASHAKLTDYKVKEYPEKKEPLQQILEDLKGDNETRILEKTFGEEYKYLKTFQSLKNAKGIQARIFYDVTVE